MILEEFDTEKKAFINPEDTVFYDGHFPNIAVTCFANTTFNHMIEALDAVKIYDLKNANGSIPVCKTNYKGKEIVVFMSMVGAPNCIGNMEELISLGVKKFVIFGTCGVLDKSILDCAIVIPNSAVRDEGTGYHYAESSDEIAVNTKHIDKFTNFLDTLGVDYHIGKTWTTDAFYRETPKKIQRRKSQGCISVDMECSAISALAQFRNVEVLQFFYGADNLDSVKWDKRSLANHSALTEKDKIATIALEMALLI